ncbi:MAG: oxidoreductase [Vicinamibacterales bacterium]
MSSEPRRTPTLGVFKFASCDGCQLSLLAVEDELLALAGAIDIAYFPEASRTMAKGPYDIGLVEGSITTHDDARRIQAVRHQCRTLITVGACATSGGIQAIRNWQNVDEVIGIVYPSPQYIRTLEQSTPIAGHVAVDFELRGCPVNKHQLLDVIAAALIGRKLHLPTYSVCVECKRCAAVCLPVSRGVPCLGPVTQAGCGAICPRFGRGCYGCYGPAESPNTASLTVQMRALGQTSEQIAAHFRGINAWAWPFRRASDDVEKT